MAHRKPTKTAKPRETPAAIVEAYALLLNLDLDKLQVQTANLVRHGAMSETTKAWLTSLDVTHTFDTLRLHLLHLQDNINEVTS